MLKKHMAACLVATAFAATPAFAQSTAPGPSGATDRPAASGSGAPTSGSPAMAPGAGAPTSGSGATTSGSATSGSSTTMPSSSSSAMSTASGSSGTFMTEQRPGQWLASKLIGTTVVSANNESIGDVNDVVMERDGKVAAVIIGVGGFLGIGEKDVAVPFSQIELTSRAAASATAPAGTAGTAPAGTAGTPGTAMPGTAMNGTAGTASTSGTVGTTMSGTGAGANMASNPDRIVLRMTKADLQNAPTFHTASRAGAATGTRSTTSGSPATGSSTTNKP